MTALYLYAIVERSDGLALPQQGFGEAPLLSVFYEDIAAVVSALAVPQATASPANVRHHEEIVEALMAVCTVLPVRFGTVLPDEVRVRDLLAVHYLSFLGALERVRDRVELGLRVLWPGNLVPSESAARSGRGNHVLTSSGREYLMARLVEERRAEALRQSAHDLAEEIHRPLAEMAVESTREVLRTSRMLLAAVYLVDRQRVDSVQAEVRTLAGTFRRLQFLLTGPWPPYNFVTRCVPALLLPGEGGRRTDAHT